VATLKQQMEEHAKVTMQIRDILASFKIIGKIAKWMTAVITACGAVYAAIKGVRA
jgi:hypothetical protein